MKLAEGDRVEVVDNEGCNPHVMGCRGSVLFHSELFGVCLVRLDDYGLPPGLSNEVHFRPNSLRRLSILELIAEAA